MAKNDRSWYPDGTDHDWIEAQGRTPIGALLAIEAAAGPLDIPIVDRATGRVLAVLAAGRRRILEVGTAYGYSTLWMSLGQPADGTIVTIDPDHTRTALARGWWREAGVPDGRIQVVSKPALAAFAEGDPDLAGPFDLVFIDALKPEYQAYVEAVVDRLNPGALVAADNVLWSGRVTGSRATPASDASTDALRAFDQSMLADPRFDATILPVGDGILIATWRGSR